MHLLNFEPQQTHDTFSFKVIIVVYNLFTNGVFIYLLFFKYKSRGKYLFKWMNKLLTITSRIHFKVIGDLRINNKTLVKQFKSEKLNCFLLFMSINILPTQ